MDSTTTQTTSETIDERHARHEYVGDQDCPICDELADQAGRS